VIDRSRVVALENLLSSNTCYSPHYSDTTEYDDWMKRRKTQQTLMRWKVAVASSVPPYVYCFDDYFPVLPLDLHWREEYNRNDPRRHSLSDCVDWVVVVFVVVLSVSFVAIVAFVVVVVVVVIVAVVAVVVVVMVVMVAIVDSSRFVRRKKRI